MGASLNTGIVVVIMLSVAFTSVAFSRDPKHAEHRDEVTASNLQVLPRDTSYADLVLLMSRYSRSWACSAYFAIRKIRKTQQVDFASDESPAKLTARIMIGMVRDINGKYLAQVSDRRYAVPISCGNCHQGQTFPPAFEAGSAP